MKSVCGRACAKINLALNVVGKENGFHILDTVLYPLDLFDTLTVTERNDDTFSVTYDNGRSYAKDTVEKAYRIMKEFYRLPGLDVSIKKRIPEGAGLGGSAADAACLARLVRLLFGTGDVPQELLAEVGSDVPAMYLDAPSRMRGTGSGAEEISMRPLDLFVLVPPATVSTAECFAEYDLIGGENGDMDAFLEDPTKVRPFNALSASAERLCPSIKNAADDMREAGLLPCVTGSGAGLFAIGGDDFDAKAEKLKKICMMKNYFSYVERKKQR